MYSDRQRCCDVRRQEDSASRSTAIIDFSYTVLETSVRGLSFRYSIFVAHSLWLHSPNDAEKLCIPAVHTKWPKVRDTWTLFAFGVAPAHSMTLTRRVQVWVYGVSFVRDGSCVTQRIAEYDGLDASDRPALKDMCLRIQLLLKQTLEAINTASPYDGSIRVGQLTTDAKNASVNSPTSTGSPGCAAAISNHRLTVLALIYDLQFHQQSSLRAPVGAVQPHCHSKAFTGYRLASV